MSVIISFAFAGCGKKGPPIIPEIKGEKIAACFDLTYKRDKSTVTLSWKHEIDEETAVISPENFEIFMAKKTFEGCAGCPFKFNMIGSVSMPAMEIDIKLEKGFKYYFRVQATGENDMKSLYSKTILVEYKE